MTFVLLEGSETLVEPLNLVVRAMIGHELARGKFKSSACKNEIGATRVVQKKSDLCLFRYMLMDVIL